MKRGERDGRLRWAFGLAVLLHAGALAALAHLPLAQASSSFDEITVFGARAPFSGALVTIVDLPPSGSPSPGPVIAAAPEPGTERETPRERPPKPAVSQRPERQAGRDPVRSHVPEEPATPAPALPAPTAAGPANPTGQGGEPAAVGMPGTDGAASAPGASGGGGEAPPAPVAGGGDGGGGTDGGGGGQGGDGGPAAGGGEGGEPGEPAGRANPGPPEVKWANPKVLRTTRPVYPKAAAENAVEGTVVMKVLVGERGEVVEATVLRSSHDPRLDSAALTAVRGWRYEPAMQDGKPRRVYTRATIRFKLR
jgi:protein TonB